MPRDPSPKPVRHVSLLVIPDAMVSSLSGLYDVLNCFELLATFEESVPAEPPFEVELVGPSRRPTQTASGLPLPTHRTLDEVEETDVVIVPSVMVEGGEWVPGRYPEVVDWLGRAHERGGTLCSACSGVLLLAETGLLDGLDATIHWAYAETFRRNFPRVRLRLEKVLVAAGERRQFVMSGASASWHDLVLYLVAREVGPEAALAISKFLLLQWHTDGQAPYVVFQPRTDHGDAAIRGAQEWLAENFATAAPVDTMVVRSGLASRTFKRRFRKATGLAPIAYVQQLRVERAKRLLESTAEPVDEISWRVGYEDPAFFRRLFKRVTGLPPGAYRKKFRIPDYAAEERLSVAEAGTRRAAAPRGPAAGKRHGARRP